MFPCNTLTIFYSISGRLSFYNIWNFPCQKITSSFIQAFEEVCNNYNGLPREEMVHEAFDYYRWVTRACRRQCWARSTKVSTRRQGRRRPTRCRHIVEICRASSATSSAAPPPTPSTLARTSWATGGSESRLGWLCWRLCLEISLF